jgi:putative peptidoglycan lipid II flippase
MALVAWGTARGLAPLLPDAGLPRQLALALVPIAAGALAYVAAAKALGIPELEELIGALRRRRARG